MPLASCVPILNSANWYFDLILLLICPKSHPSRILPIRWLCVSRVLGSTWLPYFIYSTCHSDYCKQTVQFPTLKYCCKIDLLGQENPGGQNIHARLHFASAIAKLGVPREGVLAKLWPPIFTPKYVIFPSPLLPKTMRKCFHWSFALAESDSSSSTGQGSIWLDGLILIQFGIEIRISNRHSSTTWTGHSSLGDRSNENI